VPTLIQSMMAPYPTRRLPYLAGGLSLALLLVGVAVVGPRIGGDTPRYTEGGAALWSSLIAGDLQRVPATYWIYTVPMLIIGGGHILFGDRLPLIFVLLNCILFSGVVVLQFSIWNRIVQLRSLPRAAAAFVIVAGLGQIMGLPYVTYWNYFVLSEILFLAVVACFWSPLVDAVLGNDRQRWRRAGVFAAIAVPVRPEGPLVAGVWLGARVYANATGVFRRFIEAGMFLVPGLCALALFPAFAYSKTQGADVPWFLAPDLLVGYFRSGVVVIARPETYMPAPDSYLEFVQISLVRLAYFYLPFYPGFSFLHKVVCVIWSCCMATFVIAGFRYLRRAGGRHVRLAVLAVWFAWIFGLMRTVFVVDFDWRFQLPPLVAAWIVGGCGILSICQAAESSIKEGAVLETG